jgi:hypothetical protein
MKLIQTLLSNHSTLETTMLDIQIQVHFGNTIVPMVKPPNINAKATSTTVEKTNVVIETSLKEPSKKETSTQVPEMSDSKVESGLLTLGTVKHSLSK